MGTIERWAEEYPDVPAGVAEELRAYLEDHAWPPTPWICCMLMSDVDGLVATTNSEQWALARRVTELIDGEYPIDCYGDQHIVKRWQERKPRPQCVVEIFGADCDIPTERFAGSVPDAVTALQGLDSRRGCHR